VLNSVESKNEINLKNLTIKIGNLTFPAIELEINPSKQSDLSQLGFNWTQISYSKTGVDVKLDFENPNYVST